MKISLFTLGTQGDVQPFIYLAKELQNRGHHVKLCTARNFEKSISKYGIDFVPVDADFQSLINSEEGKLMMKNPFLARKYFKSVVHPMILNSLEVFYSLAKDSDKVIFHVKTMADHFADVFPEKMIRGNVIPAIEPTAEFPNPVFSAFGLPRIFNKLTYRVTSLGLKMMQKPVDQFRSMVGLSKKYKIPELPSIYGISELFLEKPSDYPVNSHFTGFWLSNESGTLSEELKKFIESGEPPLLITFGSMPLVTNVNLGHAIDRIAKELNCRILIVKGWGFREDESLMNNPNILMVSYAAYDQLLPKVKAVIHHGGIGTITACMVAGKPFISCPVIFPMGDQYFWGNIAFRKGIGLKPAPLKSLNENKLINLTRELLNDSNLYIKSEEIRQFLLNENGTVRACQLIENL